MAVFSYTKPVVGGSQDAWGDTLNANWDALGAFLGDVDSADLALLGEIGTGFIPSGAILLWSGSVASVPTGWLLCDGANGTPDLRNRFVVGAGSTYAVNATGGADTVTLTTAQMPAHGHTFSGTTNTTGDHQHNYRQGGSYVNVPLSGSVTYGYLDGGPNNNERATSAAGNHAHTFSGTTTSVGSGQAHENRPPYLALAYIMKA